MSKRVRAAARRLALVALFALLLRDAPVRAFPREDPRMREYHAQPVASQVMSYVDAFYVEPGRAAPMRLVESAFKLLETQFPEVQIDVNEAKTQALVHVGEAEKPFDLSNLSGLAQTASLLDDLSTFLIKQLGDRAKDEMVLYLTLNGALRALDPHSNVFNTKHFKDFKVQTQGSFGGIGFTFNVMDGELTIISPIPDTPASRAGLQSGDRILYIDGRPTTNMTSDIAVGLMRGEPGTKVTLSISREGWDVPRDYPITREVIHIVSVEGRLLQDPGAPPVAYVRVKNFQTNTSGELRDTLRKIDTPQAVGVILDLRDDPGGLLDEAVKVADGFLDSGTIVSTRNRTGVSKVEKAGDRDDPYTRKPLVVLINRGSASASEIVSGALQDRRALVIGEKSFGKGSVQQAFPLTDGGGVLITVGQYFTPGDVSIQSIGIQPDVALEAVRAGAEGRVLLGPVRDHGQESNLENAFSEWGNATREPVASVRFLAPERDRAKPGEKEKPRELSDEEKAAHLTEQFEVGLARRILAAAAGRPGSATHEGLLAAARPVLAEVAREQEERIGAALAARGVDWSAGSGAGGARLVALLPQDVPLQAGQKARISVSVRNEGGAPASRVWGRTESANPLLRNLDFAFGRIEPGQSREWTAEVEVPPGAEDRWDRFTIKFQADGAGAGESNGGARSTGKARPEFAYTYTLSDENPDNPAKNGDGRLEEGERARVRLQVANRGAAESAAVEVNLIPGEKQNLYLEQARQRLEKLAVGGRQPAEFSFKAVKAMEGGKVKVAFSFADRTSNVLFEDSLEIPTTAPYRREETRVPPEISLESVPPLRTAGERVALTVTATDDAGVRDLYVYRGEKKVRYARNRDGGARFVTTFEVPLEKGENRIAIVVRDDKEIASQKVVHVYREEPETASAASAGPPAGTGGR